MTARLHAIMRPVVLFYLGAGLLLVSIASRTVMDDLVVGLYDPSQEQLSWLFTILGVVAWATIALGTAVLAAAIVLLGIQPRARGEEHTNSWSIHVPRSRPLFLSDATVLDVEAFAKSNELATDEAIDHLVRAGLRTAEDRQD